MAGTDDVSLIIERRDESLKAFKRDYHDDLTEVFRAIKCRTKPIKKRDSAGKLTSKEDKSRTNVAMPEINLAWRRNVARMTANPYRLNYTGASDPLVNEALSALAGQQYDRSREWFHDRRIVMMAEAFGFGYSKLWWDTLTRSMPFRKVLTKGNDTVFRDRAAIMSAQGAPDDEVQGAVQQLGPEMSDPEISDFIKKNGNEVTVPQNVTKYEGPCVKSVWIGDLFFEPNVLCMDDSDWVIEQYQETELFLAKMVKLKYKDPDSGEEKPVFDSNVCQKLIDADPEPIKRKDDLKEAFIAAMGRTSTDVTAMNKKLRGRKKFDFLEQHILDDDGRNWITWAAEAYPDAILGKMPYPVDLYGKWLYTELVPLPDMVDAHGDSTPRLMRHLHAMHNMTVAQNFDYVSNLLRRLILVKSGARIEADIVERGSFRELRVSDPNAIQEMQEPSLPPGALDREAQILRMEAMLEPSLNTVDTGTASNPMAGKLATTAMLNAKAADALTQFKLDGRNLYLKELGQKKLWMNQQMASEPWKIESDFDTDELAKQKKELAGTDKEQLPPWALSDRNGKVVAIRLDPMEIQEDIHVEPEAGSYLSVDDEIKTASFERMAGIALQAPPGTVDLKKVVRFGFSTIRGIGNPDDYILPDQPPAPPETRINVSVAVKWGELEPQVQAQLLESAQIQINPADLAAATALHAVTKTSEAADAADNLLSPSGPAQGEIDAQRQQQSAAAKASAKPAPKKKTA